MGTDTRVGFISPHSQSFCADCNRIRVTAEGRLLLCLGQKHSIDLRRLLRANPTEDTPLKTGIRASLERSREVMISAAGPDPSWRGT